ncbi:MAG: transcription antitermination protein NusB [Bacteroidales bacterium]|nr:transcription antitermination protein NusB [Candidatus Sodaliphilus aphodohippi]
MLYSYKITSSSRSVAQAQKELQTSLDKSYELYMYLLKLIIELTDLQYRAIDDARHKYLPSKEDLNPNTRFIDNRLVELLRNNETLNQFFNDKLVSWNDEIIFKRIMLNRILNSSIYQQYMAAEENDFESDCEVWKQLMKKVILVDDDLSELLENLSVYWCGEDLDVMGQFVVKTIRRFQDGEASPIMPMYKDEEDSKFGEILFTETARTLEQNNALIDMFVKEDNWDKNRIAMMDRLIMCTAITEMKNFIEIPIRVTLNEYIELAKIFSTSSSGQFVNGILYSVVEHLRANGEIVKSINSIKY